VDGYFNDVELLAQHGTCLMGIGEYIQAESCLAEAANRLADNPAGLRDRVHYTLRLAELGLQRGELDAASAYAENAIVLAQDIRSSRMNNKLEDFVREIGTVSIAAEMGLRQLRSSIDVPPSAE